MGCAPRYWEGYRKVGLRRVGGVGWLGFGCAGSGCAGLRLSLWGTLAGWVGFQVGLRCVRLRWSVGLGFQKEVGGWGGTRRLGWVLASLCALVGLVVLRGVGLVGLGCAPPLWRGVR